MKKKTKLDTLGELVTQLRDAGADTILVRKGAENEFLHDEKIVLEAIHRRNDPETKKSLIEVFDEISEEVVWQGHEWDLHPIVREETLNENEDVANNCVKVFDLSTKETYFEDLFEIYREVWFEKLSEMGVNELKENDDWQVRAKEINQNTNLNKRQSEVRALMEIGLSTGEIGEVIGTTTASVERTLREISGKFGSVLENGLDSDDNEFRRFNGRYVGRRSIHGYDVIRNYDIDYSEEDGMGELSIRVEYRKDGDVIDESEETHEVIDERVFAKDEEGNIGKKTVEEFCSHNFENSEEEDVERLARILIE
ncbi:MAG: hypothetical protein SV377_03780, partial [Halobacteria archaeon]|nr:hypothetical protein [Halobacteria archaeon]